MRFEERELPSYAQPVSSADLKEGTVYFTVNYIDDDLLIPTVETIVFIGRDLQPGDSGRVYFQDIDSYGRGVRYESATAEDYVQFSTGSENELSHIFEYDRALEELMKCSLRRRRAKLS